MVGYEAGIYISSNWRTMSSKRKNTPTKLAKDNVDLDTGSSFGDLEPVDISERSVDVNQLYPSPYNHLDQYDSDSHSGSEKPANKKQRLLQSVQNDSCSDSDSDNKYNHKSLNNNNITTKSTIGPHRKSMESVLRKLHPRSLDMEGSDNVTSSPKGENTVIDHVQHLLQQGAGVKDKEQRLSEMISQLQNIKENLQKQKAPAESTNPSTNNSNKYQESVWLLRTP
ncbi:hypothetical protein LOTGIDRAFT_163114 [Lottia gigantea]|uniref:Uncharacterized protein n=1 Tax=Lottia gigantea TaxID=225164 RepID=V4A4W3_LOTGI|nr:hypothetical protein LOTGIDRAFT_163114 [Lottia gigantea]ESO91752.1 hypothetical protein LOTGIDRAFT_163114 [Lottia gigantea]